MAQAVASMAGLRGATQAVLDGSRQLGGSSRLARPGSSQVKVGRVGLRIQALAGDNDVAVGRRALVSLVAGGLVGGAFVEAVLAEAKSIKVGPPPAPSGGLPGTENSDQARDLVLPLKQRFYLQPLPPTEAALRAKESAKCIVSLKGLIDKKAWPYVQNDLRLKASYLRYDLKTVISAKPKEEKKALKELVAKLYATIDGLDHAAKIKSSSEAEKYYEATKTAIDDILVKLG